MRSTRQAPTVVLVVGVALAVAQLPAAGAPAATGTSAAPPAAPAAAPEVAPDAAATARSRLRQRVSMTVSARTIRRGERVTLTGQLHPERDRWLTFRYKRIPASSKAWAKASWTKARSRAADGHGHVRVTWEPPRQGRYRIRVQSPAVKGQPAVRSSATPLTVRKKAPTYQVSAAFPATGYIDVPLTVPVTVTPTTRVVVTAQQWNPATSSWADVPGAGAQQLAPQGQATLTLQTGIAGPATFRVLASNGAASVSHVVAFDANYLDAFYTPPADPPATPGVMLRTMPMTGTQPSGALPTAALPAGTTQYRFLYTTMRYSPVDGSSTPDVSSGMVYLPPPGAPVPTGYSTSNRPVVAWAHPTLGLAQACAPSAGAEGYTTNYLDMSWFLSAGGESLSINTSGGGSVTVLPRPGGLLANGYVVVMPDYLSVATPGKETYVIGQQEANDVLYAVKAAQAPASTTLGWNAGPVPNSTWPGTGAGGDLVVAGHSQGGHAALWTGVNQPLAQSLNITLKGIVPIAPASDLLETFDYTWDTQMGWVLGPYAAKTFVDYFGPSFEQPLTPPAKQTYQALSQMCLGELEQYVGQNYPSTNGQIGGPVTTTFSVQPNPNDAAFAATWGAQLNQMTPILSTQQVAPLVPLPAKAGYPKGIPTFLVQGQGDYVILAQTTAALQETMCRAGYPLDAYYPAANPDAGAVVSGVTLPGLADHGTILNWPIPDSLFALLPNAPAGIEEETPASRVAEWIAARFLGLPQAVDCNDPWTFTPPSYKTPFGAVPASTTGVHVMVPQGACTTKNPNADDEMVPMQCWPPTSGGNYPGIANSSFPLLWAIPSLLGGADPWGNQAVPLVPNTENAGTPAFPKVDASSFGLGVLNFPGAGLYTIADRVGLFPFGANLSGSATNWTYTTEPSMINHTGPAGEALPDGYLYAKAGDATPGPTSYRWGYYPSDGVYYRTPGMPPVVTTTGMAAAMRSATLPPAAP